MIMINDSNKTIKIKLSVLKLMQYVLTFNIYICGISEGMFCIANRISSSNISLCYCVLITCVLTGHPMINLL